MMYVLHTEELSGTTISRGGGTNVTPWNRGANMALKIGMFNPVLHDSPPCGCSGDRKMFLLYGFIIAR